MSYIQELFTSRNNGANGDDFVGKQGRIWWDPVSHRMYYSDGVTPGGIPIGAGQIPSFGSTSVESYVATLGQTEFTIQYGPSGHVIGAINGATMNAGAITENGTLITYHSLDNDGYVIQDDDIVTFSYIYGTSNVSTLANLSDVNIPSPQNGSVLVYDGSSNQWVAGNPNGAFQYAIKSGTSQVKITQPDGDVDFTIDGFIGRAQVTPLGINVNDAGYRVNGNLAVNGPTIKIENKNSTTTFDACDRPIDVPYQQNIPLDVPTRVEYSRLCWDTAGRFNPTANNITVAGDTVQPWSWRPLVPGYYQITASAILETATTEQFTIKSQRFAARANQTVFTLTDEPVGNIVFSINGATVNQAAISISSKTVTYSPVLNDGYVLLLDDDVVIYQLTGGTTPMSLFSESILATSLQTEFILSETPTGVMLSSLNGATLPSYVFTVVDDTVTYNQDANDDYEIQAGDVLTFTFLNGTAGTKTLNDVSVIASADQVAFYLPTLVTGEIIASINGALISPSAFTVSGTKVVYSWTLNGNYKLENGDIVTFTYLTESSIADEWARMSVSVNGVTKILGTRQVLVANQFTIEATDILLLTPADNVSASVTHNVEPSLGMVYSSLSSSMIRGIE